MGAKTRYCTGHLYTTLWEGWTNHLSHSSGPTPGPAPAFMPYKEQAYCPPARASLTPHPLSFSFPFTAIPTTHTLAHLISVPKRPWLQPLGHEIFNPLGHFLINLGFDSGHCSLMPASVTPSWIQLADSEHCPGPRDKTWAPPLLSRNWFIEASASFLFAI